MYEVNGARINAGKEVYAPAEDTLLAADILIRAINGKGLVVADIGTGTGALGIVAALDGRVTNVLISDISENALECAKENAKLNGVTGKCSFRKSDLFENVEGNFDIIIFNPPYLPEDDEVKSGKNEWSGGPTGTETTKLFIDQALLHLNKKGTIIIVASSFADMDGLAHFIKDAGLEVTDSRTKHIFFEDITAIALKKRD